MRGETLSWLANLGERRVGSWPAARVERLRALWAQGFTCSQIAAFLSVDGAGRITRNAVIGKVSRLGLAKRATPSTPRRRPVRAAKPAQRIQRAIPAEPPRIKGAPKRGPNSVRFIDRTQSQCPMFCENEDGPLGFVCGEAVETGSWCSRCAQRVFQETPARKAA